MREEDKRGRKRGRKAAESDRDALVLILCSKRDKSGCVASLLPSHSNEVILPEWQSRLPQLQQGSTHFKCIRIERRNEGRNSRTEVRGFASPPLLLKGVWEGRGTLSPKCLLVSDKHIIWWLYCDRGQQEDLSHNKLLRLRGVISAAQEHT